ncbi:hypothetical protein C4577_04130, partial [Candidatus Parcubacteria bacterium]
TWLFLDSPYLCWRAYHTTGHLSYNSIPTGIVFGYLKTLLDLQDNFVTTKLVHCFDKGPSKRIELYPEYKGNRKHKSNDLSEDEIMKLKAVKNQIIKLRKEYLPEIGAKNVFSQYGFEADDVIASLCNGLPEGHEAVIVSEDHDLYQLLNSKIRIYSPRSKKIISEESFKREWGINPSEWVMVKALAGCSSDHIKGIKGVGEKTAVKHLRNELKQSSKVYSKILTEYSITERNLPLVRLPFPGTKDFVLVEDRLSQSGWESLSDRLGLKSLGSLRRLLPFNTKYAE